MRRPLRIGLAALLVWAATGAQADAANWAESTDDAAADPAFDASKAICRAAQAITLPPVASAAPPDCSSEALYYGLGHPPDPDKARACAMAERAKDPDNAEAFAGTAMLVTIFANGQGAPRDLGLATALACTLAGAPAEMDGRIKHLDILMREGPGAAPFSICDDATSGLSQGACAAHDSRVAAIAREQAFTLLALSWTPSQKARLVALRAAAEAFATERGDNEIDQSGSGRQAFSIEAEEAVRDDLLSLLQRLAAGLHPPAPSFATEDQALNEAYRLAMAVPDPQWGTPTKDGIKATQRLWIVYRDTLRSLVDAVFPGQGEGAAAALTRRRVLMLRAFSD